MTDQQAVELLRLLAAYFREYPDVPADKLGSHELAGDLIDSTPRSMIDPKLRDELVATGLCDDALTAGWAR